jgi:CheY-like chemotaxis protein
MTAILVAERDPQVCIVVSEILKYDLLARVVCVDTGTLAAQAIGTASFDLAIIDVNMPDISGYELARHAANRNIPTLLSTGHPDADAELTGSEFPHISKPFRTAELVSQAAIAITQAAENIRRVKAFLATIQATAKGDPHPPCSAVRQGMPQQPQPLVSRDQALLGPTLTSVW